MTVQNLFAEGQRAVQPLLDDLEVLLELLVRQVHILIKTGQGNFGCGSARRMEVTLLRLNRVQSGTLGLVEKKKRIKMIR